MWLGSSQVIELVAGWLGSVCSLAMVGSYVARE